MNHRVHYLTPYPPVESSIGDYAAAFRGAVERFSPWRLEVAEPFGVQSRFTPRDLRRLRRQVIEQREQGFYDRFALAHAEIANWQHFDFWRLFWMRSAIPALPYCLTVHDSPVVIAPALYWLSGGLQSGMVRRALRLLDCTPLGRGVVRAVVRGAAHVFVLTHRGAEALRRRFAVEPGRVTVLPHVSFQADRPPPTRAACRNKTVTVLFFGLWGPSKGIDVLVRAAERLAARGGGPNMRFVLAGRAAPDAVSREYAESVRRMIDRSSARDRIDVPGRIPAAEVDDLFTAADILALPYVKAPRVAASGVLTRAMAAGLAVAASDTAAVSEDILDGRTGLLVPPGDAEALAATLRRLAEDGALRRTLGGNAQDHLFDEHGWEHVAALAARAYASAGRSTP